MDDGLPQKPFPLPAPLPLDYATPMRRNRLRIPVWVEAVGAALVLVVLGLVLMPAWSVSRPAYRVQCGVNMHRIVTASIAYAQMHANALPDSIDTVKKSFSNPPADLFVCPATTGILRSGVPYIYVGKGLNLTSAPKDTILLYEPTTNHAGSTINVGYIDGSVKVIGQPQAGKLIAELQSGHNPPRAEMVK